MSSKTNTSDNTAQSKTSRNYQVCRIHDDRHKCITASPSKEVMLLSQGDIIEVTVKREDKTKGQKRTSPTVNSRYGQKAERKRSMINDNKTPQSWRRIFTEQNLLYMKQEQASTSVKSSDSMDTRKHIKNANKQTTNAKQVDPVSSKRTPFQKKLTDNSKMSSCQSIFVQDRAVQYPDVTNNASRDAEFNPVHTLSLLIKELKHLVKSDKKTSEIFIEMEHVLSKIPLNSGESLELGDLEIKLQTSTSQLMKSNKQMKTIFEAWTVEREKLHSQIQRQEVDLKKANRRQADLEIEKTMLVQQLKDATQTAKDEITTLRRQIKKDELSEELISDLRTELTKQTELARKNFITNQYLAIERDKLSQLFSYQETLITQYQYTIKELQMQVTEQLKALNEARKNEDNASSQSSITQMDFMCSSPASSTCDPSNKPWVDFSDISSVPPEYTRSKEHAPMRDLEFVSLEPGGDSSHDIMFDSCQN